MRRIFALSKRPVRNIMIVVKVQQYHKLLSVEGNVLPGHLTELNSSSGWGKEKPFKFNSYL